MELLHFSALEKFLWTKSFSHFISKHLLVMELLESESNFVTDDLHEIDGILFNVLIFYFQNIISSFSK